MIRVHEHDAGGELEEELTHERELLANLYDVEEETRRRGTGETKLFLVSKQEPGYEPKQVRRITPAGRPDEWICTCKDFVFRGKDKKKNPTMRQNGKVSKYKNSVNYWDPRFVREEPDDFTRGVILGAKNKGCKHIIAVKNSLEDE